MSITDTLKRKALPALCDITLIVLVLVWIDATIGFFIGHSLIKQITGVGFDFSSASTVFAVWSISFLALLGIGQLAAQNSGLDRDNQGDA